MTSPHQGEKNSTPPPLQTHNLYASGIKSADFWIRIAEKTRDPHPIDCLKSEGPPPHMHSLKTSDPPLYSATPSSAEIYEQSLIHYVCKKQKQKQKKPAKTCYFKW